MEDETDRLFLRAWRSGLTSLDPDLRRGVLCGVIGHVAESVAELLLADLGYQLVWDQTGVGGRGIDLLALSPDGEHLVVVEVKGTLRPGRWPRLTNRGLRQMSAAWLDGVDNVGMTTWGLTSEDIYGAVFAMNFATMQYRVAMTADFVQLLPVLEPSQLADLTWLVDPPLCPGGTPDP